MSPQLSKKRKELGINLLLLLALSLVMFADGVASKYKGELEEIKVVEDQTVQIPCDAHSSSPNDTVLLILWYKNKGTTPIYSFDARRRNGRHWVDEVELGDRAELKTESKQPYLNLLRVHPRDDAVYVCRVDYRRKPTKKSYVRLIVIIPPGVPTIIDENNVVIQDGVLGPYDEGSTLNVTCQVAGGKPPPQVKWWRREVLLDDVIETKNDSVRRNTLQIGPLKREHLKAFFVCQATNNNKELPISKGVTLDVNFKPLSVEIMGDRSPVVAGKEHNVSCKSIGAKPAADITWWLDGVDLTEQSLMETEQKSWNISNSILSIVPKEEDAGKLLTCKAQSPVIAHPPLEDSWMLEIYYTPKVEVQLDADLDPKDIREGRNVTFNCIVNSHPEATHITWFHKGILIQSDDTNTIKMEGRSLILTYVGRHQWGVYTCGASNIVGDGQSQPLILDVKYAPVCSYSENQILGAGKADNIDLLCRVEASPGALSFKWHLRTPNKTIDIPENRYDIQDRISHLNYHIRTQFDYGDFLCYATNELGEQSEPCVFTVVPSGKPDSLKNCTVTNETTDTLFISCVPGFNGGLDQHYVIVVQAYDNEVRGDILRNATETEEPVFVIEGLQPDASYLLAMYSKNVKGRSEDSVLHGFTLPTPPGERITLTSNVIFPITPILGVLIGVVGALVIVAVVVVVVMKLRSDARSAKGSPKGRSNANLKGPHAPLQPAKDNDDGPDVILYPPYEDVDGIPPKLKHANIYETVQCESKENSKNSEKSDQDDVEYAELTFTNGKNKTKGNKKSGVNGTIRSSEDNTIYASIDHTLTAQLKHQPKQAQPKQAQPAKQDHNPPLKGKQQAMDHLDSAAEGENDDIPLMDTARESSV